LATIRRTRPDIPQTQRLSSLENRAVSTLPIGVAVIAVAAKNVEIAGRDDAMIRSRADQSAEVGKQPMS